MQRQRERCACGAEFEAEGDYLTGNELREWRERHAVGCALMLSEAATYEVRMAAGGE